MLGKGGFILEIDVVLLERIGLLLERSGLLLGVLDDMDIPERSQAGTCFEVGSESGVMRGFQKGIALGGETTGSA